MGNLRKNANWIQAYLTYTENTEAPLHFHFWTAISTIAGALRRNVYFDQTYFKWFPNFYIIIVAAPGIVNKTTTIDIGMNLLRKVPGIYFGPESVTWQALVERMGQCISKVQYPDGTEEENCAITIPIPEFGTFFNTEDHKLTDLLVSLWDGRTGKFERATRTQGSDSIINPWVNLIAGTTPSWISSNFPAYMVGGGFTSRCVFVYGEKKRQHIAYPRDFKTPEFLALEDSLIEDLTKIAELRGEFTLTPEARAFGEAWYASIFENIANVEPALQGHWARKQTQVHKLAMVLSVSERDDLVIEKEHLEKAALLVQHLEKDIEKIFMHIGSTQDGSLNASILTYIQSKGRVPKHILFRNFMTKANHRQLEETLMTLVKSGSIEMINTNNVVYLISRE
jgi:hypothetical protein